jgi:hypothetical protein
MYILLYKDTLIKYFNSKNIKSYSSKDILDKIIENDSNKLILSSTYIELLEKQIAPDKLDFFKTYITHILDNNRIKSIKTSKKSLTLEDEFEEINNNNIENFLIKIAMEEDDIIKKLSNVTILNMSEKTNIHWIKSELACNNKLTLRYYEFKDNKEIKDFFDNIFSLPQKINIVNIFDRYCNLEHDYFNYLPKNKILVYYYSCLNRTEDKIKKEELLKKKLGGKSQLYITNTSKNIHERKILFENLILETDEDFENLDINRHTWKIDFTYCENTTKELLKKKVKFTKFIIF